MHSGTISVMLFLGLHLLAAHIEKVRTRVSWRYPRLPSAEQKSVTLSHDDIKRNTDNF